MRFDYFTDEEYESAFDHFGGIRSKIAVFVSRCHSNSVNTILDVPAGHGYHIAEFSKIYPETKLIAAGLPSDVLSHRRLKDSDESIRKLLRNLEYLVCDATEIPLNDGKCDMIVNFLGLEDIRMTRGVKGVRAALGEMSRVLNSSGILQLSLVEYGDSEEERVAEEVWKTIGLDAIFFPCNWFLEEMRNLGMSLHSETVFVYPRKMTSNQAAEELEFACENAPSTFSEFGVSTISFDDLWNLFSDRIREHGMAYWSRIRVLLFRHKALKYNFPISPGC